MINSITINYDEGDSDVFVKQVPQPDPVGPIAAADADLPVEEAPVSPETPVEPAPETPVSE